jgi:hypothetical protein
LLISDQISKGNPKDLSESLTTRISRGMKLEQKLFSLLIVWIALLSCKKENVNTITSEDIQLADAAFNHIESIVNIEVNKLEKECLGEGESYPNFADTNSIINIMFSLNTSKEYIDTIWINYGTDGCEWRGRILKGKVLITQDGKRSTLGTITKVELNNFFIDDYKVEGVKTIEKTDIEFSLGNSIDHVLVTGGQLTSPDKTQTIQWNSDRIHKNDSVNGESFILIEGSINGVNTEGTAFTITTGKPLKLNSTCTRIVEGELKVTPSEMSTRTLNYGDGTCDLKATVTIEDKDYEIILW